MSKILAKIFPLFDHLYIFQNYEYSSLDFIKWFLRNPLKRNLQKKHKLVWTQKAKLLALFSLALLVLDSIATSYIFTKQLWLGLILLLIKSLYSPLFLIIAQILIWPLEYYQKQKILTAAKEKLSHLPNLKIVAITGSFGKTSTKDILNTLLWKRFYVVKTPKSFNTPLSIAQTVLDLVKDNTDIFICEIGAYKRGEIKKIADLIKPTVAVVTAIAPQHLEKFGSLENIALAKFELPQSLPKNGIAILNSGFEWIKKLSSSINTNIVFYGTLKDPFYATDINIGIDGTSFVMHIPKGKTEIKIPLIGEHHIQNFLAAAAAALNLGLTLKEIQERAKLLLTTPHRMEIITLGNITLIDNSYNTNPISAHSSLQLLSTFKARKIVITPGLVELGKKSSQENEKFGEQIATVADEIIIVGKHAKKDLLAGIQKDNLTPKNAIHLVNSTQEAFILAQQLTKGLKTVALLENDLPDQYS